MNRIDVSIIIPIYNVEKYLRQCLDSVYSIKNLRKEIILVNDSSPDNSKLIIEEYKKLFPEETVVVERENGGLSAARNSGLKIAKGEYVSFIDSDDFVDPIKFETLFINGNQEKLDIIIGRAKKIWDEKKEKKELLSVPEEFKNQGIVEGKNYLVDSLKYKKHRVEVWDDFYKRDFLLKNNLQFKEGILHEDVLFTFKAFCLANKVKFFDLDFYYYRQREGSIMSTINEKSYFSRLIIVEELLKFYEYKKINIKEFNDYLIDYIWAISKILKKLDKKIVVKLLRKFKYSLKSFIKCTLIYFKNIKK